MQELDMFERPYWWSPEDQARRGDWRRSSQDRPYWWRDESLPFRHDEERAMRDYERAHEARHPDYEDDRRYQRAHRGWGDKATDEVKSWLGNERAERRRDLDREIEAHEERLEQLREERREERRDFRGVGPRTRADDDDDLREEISDRLRDDPDLDASDILVRVIDNEAILDGTVRSKRDAERAHHLASEVRGVVYVRDRLRVGRSGEDRVRRATIGMGYDDTPSHRRH
jgi:osmotically-inducible protein OsmY